MHTVTSAWNRKPGKTKQGWFENNYFLFILHPFLEYNMMEKKKNIYGDFMHNLLLFLLLLLLSSCSTTPSSSTKNTPHSTLSTNNGVITYNASPQDVLIRTFYGGGKLGSFEYSPEISIYGDGSYILGPGLQMRQGQLSSDALAQLLHTLVDTNGLLKFSTKRFYDVPDQNATFLQLMLNGASYTFHYGPFGNLH